MNITELIGTAVVGVLIGYLTSQSSSGPCLPVAQWQSFAETGNHARCQGAI